MKLFGLKNEAGEEVILHSFVGKDDHTRYIGDVEIVKKPPQFKTGDWIIGNKECYRPYEPRLITSISRDEFNAVQYNYFDDFNKTEKNGCNSTYLRLATPQEIESHLKKICDEKYIGKKAKCIDDEGCHTVKSFKFYWGDSDSLYYYSLMNNCSDIVCLYRQGKFAEIVPDKKKLPKTKVELEILIKELRVAKSLPLYNEDIDFFLNKYED